MLKTLTIAAIAAIAITTAAPAHAGYLNGMTLQGVDLNGMTLQGVNLQGVTFNGTSSTAGAGHLQGITLSDGRSVAVTR